MSDNRKDLPPASAPNFNERLRETISTYLGHRGNKLDRGVTLRDLSEANIIALSKGFLANPGGTAGSSGVRPISGLGSAATYEIDLAPPPPPDGLSATTSGTSIQVTIAAQTYRQGHGPAKVIVFGAKYLAGGALPTYADAAVLDEFYGDVHAFPVDAAALYRIWAKSVSVDGVESSVAGGTNGVEPTPGLLDDVSIASLTASKIRSGSITVGQFIQASNYVAGVAGWRINGDGTAELANAIVRGGVFASYGKIGGNTIDASGLQSPGYVPGASGWRLDSGGAFYAKSGAFSGSLSGSSITGATGTFSGALTGADITGTTGTFSGKLAAGTVDFASSVGVTRYYYPGWNTVTVPDGMTSMRVLLIGAGGGGGGGSRQDYGASGGGGGAGGQRSGTYNGLYAGQQFSLYCGAGGVGGVPPSVNWGSWEPGSAGTSGEDTTLSGYMSAGGGGGGDGSTNGGVGGTGGTVGAAGETGPVGDPENWRGGYGASVPGYGTGGIPTSSVGGPGTGYGSGGAGGAWHRKGYDYYSPGGAGAPGFAVIEFFNSAGVVLRAEMSLLKTELRNSGIVIT